MSERTPSAHSMTVGTPETERENLAAKLSVLERENAKLKKDNDKTNAALEGARRLVESTVALLGIYSECEERTYDDCIEPVRKAIENLQASKNDARMYAYGADRFGGEVLRALEVDEDLKGRSYDECTEPVLKAIKVLKEANKPWDAIQDDLAKERATVARLSREVAELRGENTSLLQTTRDLQAAVAAAKSQRAQTPYRDDVETGTVVEDFSAITYDRNRADLRVRNLELELEGMNGRFFRLQQMAIGMIKSI